MTSNESIPFHVDIKRIVHLLANQIYQSPLALLRENCQNAYDAILIRRHVDQNFSPEIRIEISNHEIAVKDNGIGMSLEEVKQNYWRAGSSGKNNAEARAAGVVGTFGIGAMANFGIADEMEVVTEKFGETSSIKSRALKESLSATDDCIEILVEPAANVSGTTVTARSTVGFNVNLSQAQEYVSGFVKHADIPVFVNGIKVSGISFEQDVKPPQNPVCEHQHEGVIHGTLQAKIEIVGSATEIWVRLSKVVYGGKNLKGEMLLRQNLVHLRGFRSRFALATSSVSSSYRFGGIADFNILEPTAGREALTTSSVQTLQQFVTAVESFVSLHLATQKQSNSNQGFIAWAAANKRFDLCRNLEVRVEPTSERVALGEMQTKLNRSASRYYDGNDANVIQQSATEDSPLIVISRDGHRRACEINYLQKYFPVAPLDRRPKVKTRFTDLSRAQNAVVYQLDTILKRDYFVEANVTFGELTQPNLPFLIDPNATPIDIVLSDSGSSISTILKLYESNYRSFTSFIKDFVRSTIFPQISARVPSSTRQGAESFLKLIQRPKEQFSIDDSVTGDLNEIWQRVQEGTLTPEEAAKRSTAIVKQSVQVVAGSEPIRNVLPDVVDNQSKMDQSSNFEAMPAITRPKAESDKILLTIPTHEQAINGFRTFLGITERVRDDRGDFFLQPHFTQIVWGGQKVLFIFQHHSREFSLYYEVLAKEFVSDAPGAASFSTTTIAIRNQTYIPIPDAISAKFIPGQHPKEFYSRCDLLYPEIDDV